jgi:transposase
MRKPKPSYETSAIETRHALVRRLSADGLSVPQIAAAVGLNRATVQVIRKRLGLSRTVPRPYPPETWERAEQLLDGGASYREVARTLGVSDQTIINHLPGRGWSEQQRVEYLRALGTHDPDYAWLRHKYGGPFEEHHLKGRAVEAALQPKEDGRG